MADTDTTLVEYQLAWRCTTEDYSGSMAEAAPKVLAELPDIEVTESFGGTMMVEVEDGLDSDIGFCFTAADLDHAVKVQRVVQAWLLAYVDPRYEVRLTPGPTGSVDRDADGG